MLIEVVDVRSCTYDEVFASAAVINVDPREASSMLTALSTELPLQRYEWGHLKRVRREKNGQDMKLEIILCPQSDFDFIPKNLLEGKGHVRFTDVAKIAPITRGTTEGML